MVLLRHSQLPVALSDRFFLGVCSPLPLAFDLRERHSHSASLVALPSLASLEASEYEALAWKQKDGTRKKAVIETTKKMKKLA